MLDLDDIADVVAGAVREATAPLIKRIGQLEARELPQAFKGAVGPRGEPGEKGDAGEVDMAAVEALILGALQRAVEALPAPEKGEPGERGPQGEAPEVDMGAVKALIDAAVASLPPAERGEPGERGIDGLAGASGAEGAPGGPGRDGKDGIGLADALKDAEGNLVLVMTDGRTKSLGPVNGADGLPGKDGRDGLGFDDLNVEQVGERTVRFLLKRGGDAAEFDLTLPIPIYRGVFKEAEPYEPADLVTWAGSLWHCNEPRGLKPGAPDSGWQLAAKAGRPGKDAGK